ncbi:EAL domain-containing protein [Brevibacillus sp. IT-7CA2]|uniref:EAL domain-containing protein n=1 Tax=Brevibacillus sp. IT-7CA2 TaxID=3026436 RepID=UPI0039E1E529
MIAQPIVDLVKQEVVMEEWLCRPQGMLVESFFSVENQAELWKREAMCLREAMKMKSKNPKSINLSLSSMPYFLETSWSWDGIIEIVEWAVINRERFQEYTGKLKERGLQVWLDDLTRETWDDWKTEDVDGYKISFEEAIRCADWLNLVKQKGKPIIVERIETREMEKAAIDLGLSLGQGYLYSKQIHSKSIVKSS